MLGYVMFGTNNLDKSAVFYDAILGELWQKRLMDTPTFICWGTNMEGTGFCITKPFNGEVATVGNGTMHAFAVDSKEKVDKMYKKALELGATDEGAPGYREEFGDKFYPAYLRDLDGNKFNFFYMEA